MTHRQTLADRPTATDRFTLGEVEVIRVREWQGTFDQAAGLVPDADPALWRAHAADLAPDHWDPERDLAVLALQTWVLRSAGRTVVVDPGVGAGRERPDSPAFHHREGDLLAALAGAGVRAEDVDVVVNTHLHGDHVGWNTRAENGAWAPSFPHARYLIPAADEAFFGPAGGYAGGRRVEDRLIHEDSVAPVLRDGLVDLWEEELRIDEHLTLEPAPGHTPGSAVLRLESGGERAVFVGDLVHSPVQILAPEHNSCFCQDPAQAAATRRRVLARAADRRELLLPAHFAGASALEVRATSHSGFTLGPWAPLTRT
ncbi:MBL fold metallo-hydrolase [Streptomyces sp. BI20]|uniref:MBL fold metallo-hydrolase n=1 Tax=Streptomyces sp. BI20 TaxID=3403460 RepID=UPI003C76AB57